MNRVILLGHLTKDIEVRYSQNDFAIGKSSLAVNRKAKTVSGEYRDETMFIDITIFGKTAETASKWFKKGSKILVEGRLDFSQWQDQNGMNRSKHSIVVESFFFPDSKSSSGNQNSNRNNQNRNSNWGNQNQSQNYQNNPKSSHQEREDKIPEVDINDMDDQIPF
jgi:single-strand DNA-binding protein